jgi:hypothetical protein
MTPERWTVTAPPLFGGFIESRTKRQKMSRLFWPLRKLRRLLALVRK